SPTDEPSSSSYLSNPASRTVAVRELDAHPVAGDQPDEVGAEAIGDVGEDPDPVLQLDPVHSVGKSFEDPAVDDLGRSGHERVLYRKRRALKLQRSGARRPRWSARAGRPW